MAESKYKLTYFNVKGLSEYIRYIFSYANVDFEDNRIVREDWPALKEKQPYGTLPILEVDGKVLNQSVAMLRYLGKRFGLVAEDPFTDALLEALVDNIRDSQQKLREAFIKKTPEAIAESKKANAYLFDRIEPLLADGYFYGTKLTWVDIYFAGLCDTISDYQPEFLDAYPKLKAHVEKIRSNDGIKKYIKNRPKSDPPAQ